METVLNEYEQLRTAVENEKVQIENDKEKKDSYINDLERAN